MKRKRLSQAVSACVVVGLLLCTLWGNAAYATTYYVAKTGDDANSGTEQQPFETITHGMNVMSAGDTLLIRGGAYGQINANDANLTIPTGTSWGNAPVIAAYPGETVILNPHAGESINLNKSYIQYVIFKGLIIDAAHNTSTGISIREGVHHIRFQNVEVKNSQKMGVTIFPTANFPNPNSFIEFIECDVHHSGSHGFYISTSNNLITQSSVHHNGLWGIHAFYNSNTNNSLNTRVSKNVFSRNTVFNNGVNHGSAPGILLSSGDGNMAYNNVVYGNNNGIVVENNNPTNTKVFNNTIYKNQEGGGINIEAQSTGAIVKNNFILWEFGSGITDKGVNTTEDKNLEIDFDITPTYDPKFRDAANFDFHLEAGSPAIDEGAILSEVQDDYDGLARPQGAVHDVGAFEFPGGGGDPPPAAPTGLSASVSGTTITLTWTANTESDLSGYKVFRGTSPGSYPSVTSVGTVVSYQATGLNAGSTYYFALKAVDAGSNESDISGEVNATTANGGTSFPPAMSSPAPGSTLTSSTVTFVGGHSSSDVAHALWVGTSVGANNLSSGGLSGHSRTVSGLPSSGTIFVRYWSANGDPSNGSSWQKKDHTYTMNVGGSTQPLTVTRVGSGTVTSAPSGINCGSTCTATYNAGTTVTLTASAASGSTFASWSGGGCSGSGTCAVTMSQAQTVTATFNAASAFPPSMSSPASGSTLTSSTVTFVGGHTSSDVAHALWVGTTQGSQNFSSGALPTHTRTVSGLPSSGTIWVRYWSTDNPNTSMGWVYTDHMYTMNVGGN